MDRRLWGIAAAVLALVMGAYLASPLVAVDALRAAAKSGDRDRLEQLTDFPAVRAHLKEDLSARLLVKLRSDPELAHSPLAGLGLILGPAIVDRAIDAYVTPDAVAAMIRGGKAPQPGLGVRPERPDEDGAVPAGGDRVGDDRVGDERRARDRPRVRMAYADLDHFRVTVGRADRPDQALGLVLQRRDLFWWRLTRIELPQDRTGSAPAPQEAMPSQETTPAGEMQPSTPQSSEPQPSSPPPTPQSQAQAQAQLASPPAPAEAEAQPRPLGPPRRTSYDCAKVHSFADVTVCHDAQLAAQDRRLPALYENALARDATGRVEEEARGAAAARRACQTRECLSRWYRRRVAALAIWEGN
ncbi:MAG: DUF2939 domain-containing protein [Caulobacteraceae bacterium]|nr:DUF2939 domain-containing protein [Caulobacteraceae bacterium]